VKVRLLLGVALCLCVTASPVASEPAGDRPAYLAGRPLSEVPNQQAILRRIWAPGLDDGYTPQGLAVVGDQVHVAAYGPSGCRLFGLSRHSGALRSMLDVPGCRHGGGLAALGAGRFVLADTRALFVIDAGAVTARIALAGSLRGSYADFDGTDLWIGSYERDKPGTLWRLPLDRLARTSLGDADPVATLAVPPRAQGMAFHKGSLWLSFSGSRFGRLARIDPATGAENASYAMPAGIEDIGFDDDGVLWAVSEAGARRYRDWPTTFPLVFGIDTSQLR
jgi:hypothetical protein